MHGAAVARNKKIAVRNQGGEHSWGWFKNQRNTMRQTLFEKPNHVSLFRAYKNNDFYALRMKAGDQFHEIFLGPSFPPGFSATHKDANDRIGGISVFAQQSFYSTLGVFFFHGG